MVDIYLKPIAILKYLVQSARLNQHWDVYPLTPALRLGLVTVIYLNWALALTVPDLQSIGQQTCSDYLLSIPQ